MVPAAASATSTSRTGRASFVESRLPATRCPRPPSFLEVRLTQLHTETVRRRGAEAVTRGQRAEILGFGRVELVTDAVIPVVAFEGQQHRFGETAEQDAGPESQQVRAEVNRLGQLDQSSLEHEHVVERLHDLTR